MTTVSENNEIITSTNIEHLVKLRAKMIADVKHSVETLQGVETAMSDYYHLFRFSSCYTYGMEVSSQAVEKATRRIDQVLWSYLMERSNMFNLMDTATKNKFRKDLENPPEFTVESVAATFAELLNKRSDIFEDGIINLFKNLSWCYKTNLPQKFGKRIVKTGYASNWLGYMCVQHGRGTDELIDLERILLTIDGKPQPDYAQVLPNKINDQQRNKETRSNIYENEYLEIKLFKNNNAHIMFKRPDLIDRMNQVIAKRYPNALPAPK